MSTKTQWTASDLSNAKPVTSDPSRMSVLEFQDDKGEWHAFDVLKTPSRLVFGGYCNAGFLGSGYIEREEYESLNETLLELLCDLKAYYNEGPDAVSRIVCNERM